MLEEWVQVTMNLQAEVAGIMVPVVVVEALVIIKMLLVLRHLISNLL